MDALGIVSSVVAGSILAYVSHEIIKEKRSEKTIFLGFGGVLIRFGGVFGMLMGCYGSAILFPKKWFQSDYNKLMDVYTISFSLLCAGVGIMLERSLIGWWV